MASAVHVLSIVGIGAMLTVQLFLYQSPLSFSRAKMIQKSDALYGGAAILALVSGFFRVAFTEKGWDYYFSNWIFLVKILIFIGVGLLSLIPTIHFFRWRKALKSSQKPIISASEERKIRLVIRLELALFLILPFLAALMARGIGVIQ